MFIVIGKVFAFPLVSVVFPTDQSVVLVPSIVIVTFDEFIIEAVSFNPVSSVPTKLNEYFLVDELYDLLLTSSAHTGAVASTVNVYCFATLLFPDVSTNAPAFIFIITVPLVKLFIVTGNVLFYHLMLLSQQ